METRVPAPDPAGRGRWGPICPVVVLLPAILVACNDAKDPVGPLDEGPVSSPQWPLLTGTPGLPMLLSNVSTFSQPNTLHCSVIMDSFEEVVGWSFEPSDPEWVGMNIERQTNVGSTQWTGDVVMSGTVRVHFWADQPAPAEYHVSIAPLTGDAFADHASDEGHVQGLEVCIVDEIGLAASRYCSNPSEKNFLFSEGATVISNTDVVDWSTFQSRFSPNHIQDQGPNHGVWYWGGPPIELRPAWAMNRLYTPAADAAPSTGLPGSCSAQSDWNTYGVNNMASGCVPSQSFEDFLAYVATHEGLHITYALNALSMSGVTDLHQRLRNIRAGSGGELMGKVQTAVGAELSRVLCEGLKSHTGQTPPPGFEMWRPGSTQWQLDTVSVDESVPNC